MNVSMHTRNRKSDGPEPKRPDGGTRSVDPLTVTEAGRLLRVSRRTIERMVARGLLPFYELPVRGGLRFSREELEAFLNCVHHDRVQSNG